MYLFSSQWLLASDPYYRQFSTENGIPSSEVYNIALDKLGMPWFVTDRGLCQYNGFETKIGERGVTLSGGQKQRVSIARAIIKNPQLLIFDDCLSAVDTKTEDAILGSLKKLMHNKSSIIISHSVSSVKTADHILVLAEGKIAEQGTHDELIALKNNYYEMHRLQLLEQEKNKPSA